MQRQQSRLGRRFMVVKDWRETVREGGKGMTMTLAKAIPQKQMSRQKFMSKRMHLMGYSTLKHEMAVSRYHDMSSHEESSKRFRLMAQVKDDSDIGLSLGAPSALIIMLVMVFCGDDAVASTTAASVTASSAVEFSHTCEGIGSLATVMAPYVEPSNALSLPTWAVHTSSVIEWAVGMSLMWKYGEVSGNPRWKGMSWGMLPCLGSAMCACTWHFFYNSQDVEFLVALQAFLTVVGNFTCWFAAYRIYQGALEESSTSS